MKEKFLWAGIILIVISGISNYIYFQSKQLDEPIFLDHYYKLSYGDGEIPLAFYYLTDKHDPLTVNYVVINGVEVYPVANGGMMFWSGNEPQIQHVQEFRHQYLISVRLKVRTESIPHNKPWSFNKMTVHFSDGTQMDATVGEVVLTNRGQHERAEALETRMGSSNNQHRETKAMIVTEPLTVEAISIPFADEISDDMEINFDLDQEKLKELEAVDITRKPPAWVREGMETGGNLADESILPLTLEKDEWLRLLVNFNPNHKSYVDLEIGIVGTTKAGVKFIHPIIMNDRPHLDQNDVEEIIAAKRDGEQE